MAAKFDAVLLHVAYLFPCQVVRIEAHIVGDEENGGLHAVFFEDGIRDVVIIPIAVVKGEEDRIFRQGAACF